MTYPETKLDRAVRRAIEAQLRGFVQMTDERGYPIETLDDFAARAGTDTWHPRDGYTDNFEVLR